MAQLTQKTWSIGATNAPLPPKVPGLPFLGNALEMGKDPIRFAVENYHKYGPIYRVQIPGREAYILAGMAANDLAKHADEEIFTNTESFGWANDLLGPSLVALENAEHAHLRRQIRPAYSRVAVGKQIDTLTRCVDEFVDKLQVGQSFDVFESMQEVVVNQLGHVMLGYPPQDVLPQLRTYMKTILDIEQFNTRPRFFYQLPQFKKAQAAVKQMVNDVLAYLRSTQPGIDRPRTAIDIMLEETDLHGNKYSQEFLMAEAIAPYLAGQDTVAGTLSFICYTMHKYQDVHARATQEARERFSPQMSMSDLRQLDVFHKAIKETMRLYPIGIFMFRSTIKEFEFNGYRVPQGVWVYSAAPVTHFLPEYYEDPFTFNIDRPPGPGGTFVPYGVGNWACLGAGIADIQLMVTMAALFRKGRFELDPPDYELRMTTMPVPNPGKYKLKLVERYDV